MRRASLSNKRVISQESNTLLTSTLSTYPVLLNHNISTQAASLIHLLILLLFEEVCDAPAILRREFKQERKSPFLNCQQWNKNPFIPGIGTQSMPVPAMKTTASWGSSRTKITPLKGKKNEVTQVVFNSLGPHGLQPTRLLCPWDFADKGTGVGCHFLLQEISYPRDWTWVSYIAGRHSTTWASREAILREGGLWKGSDALSPGFRWWDSSTSGACQGLSTLLQLTNMQGNALPSHTAYTFLPADAGAPNGDAQNSVGKQKWMNTFQPASSRILFQSVLRVEISMNNHLSPSQHRNKYVPMWFV